MIAVILSEFASDDQGSVQWNDRTQPFDGRVRCSTRWMRLTIEAAGLLLWVIGRYPRIRWGVIAWTKAQSPLWQIFSHGTAPSPDIRLASRQQGKLSASLCHFGGN
jgi:hypothetical protein